MRCHSRINGEEHGDMSDGMSSVNEYWKRARSIENSDSESISSTCSFDDTNSSSSKEYCDASCNVDFDDETDELVEGNIIDVPDKLSTDVSEVPIPSKNGVDKKFSRYVRWNVLMGLGIGLWIFLCIVDVLHSEKSVTKEWLYGLLWERKIVTKVEFPKKIENPVLWYSNLSSYLWKIISIVTSGGAYVLLFILMIVFCADPRLRNIGSRSSKSVCKKMSPLKSKNSSKEEKSLVVEKKIDASKIPKIMTVRLELVPSLELQRKFFSSIEKCVQADFKKINSPVEFSHPRKTRLLKIRDSNRQESMAGLGLRRELANLLDAKYRTTLQYPRLKFDWPKKIEAIVKDSTSLCLVDSRKKSELNSNASTFDLEIGEFLTGTEQSSMNLLYKYSYEKNRGKRNFANGRLENYQSPRKTRIITSSPAFKKFLSSFQHNSAFS